MGGRGGRGEGGDFPRLHVDLATPPPCLEWSAQLWRESDGGREDGRSQLQVQPFQQRLVGPATTVSWLVVYSWVSGIPAPSERYFALRLWQSCGLVHTGHGVRPCCIGGEPLLTIMMAARCACTPEGHGCHRSCVSQALCIIQGIACTYDVSRVTVSAWFVN